MKAPSPHSLTGLPAAIPGWRMTARQVLSARRHVTICPDSIPEILPWLEPGPPNEAWRGYVSPVDPAAPDLSRLFFELALTISQFGGFIGYDADGSVDSWKRDGSGIKAILATMADIRAARKLPGIDIHGNYDRELAHFFIHAPFGRQRLDILKEVGSSAARRIFHHTLPLALRSDGSYFFSMVHLKFLACRFPLAFGQDPVFYKKASLLLMTMEIALNQLGTKAVAETLPPADYRIPQILEGLGILQFSERLTGKIGRNHVFRLDAPEVRAIRAAAVEAAGLIKQEYERHYGRKTTCAEIDGLLYLLSRNRQMMDRAMTKPHIQVATIAF
ncbi:MAG: queuosine salvage family protein [Rhodomicrobium sp.]